MPDSTTVLAETAPLLVPPDDPDCRYPALPTGMATFARPSLSDWRGADTGAARALLEAAAGRLAEGGGGVFDLTELDGTQRRFVAEVLGEGEIRMDIALPPDHWGVREAVFAGLWRVRRRQDDIVIEDMLAAGALPWIVTELARRLTAGFEGRLPRTFPPGLMNAPALVAEIFHKAREYRPGKEDVLNLTLFPLNPEDSRFLADTLGLAGFSILSKGYGDCRIQLTRVPNVWWVQYYNASEQLILNTLEITAMPGVVPAAPEDLADSGERLKEALADLS
jgi:hydrogenase-1 operon protein HyaF